MGGFFDGIGGFLLPALAGGLGGAPVGDAANSALGLGLSDGAASALGGAALGAGMGFLGGGEGKGALRGALMGGIAPMALGSFMGGGSPMAGLFGGGGGDHGFDGYNGLPDVDHGGYGPDMPRGGGALSMSGGARGGFGGLFGGGGGGMGSMLPLMMMAGALSGGGGAKAKTAEQQLSQGDQDEHQRQLRNQSSPLSVIPFNRTYQPPKGNLEKYGQRGGEQEMFSNNRPPGWADGGMPQRHGALAMAEHMPSEGMGEPLPSRYVDGPGDGRSDDVPARVARGEYIMDAETVSHLGNGSSEAGAERLDKFRENIRKHKGKSLAKGDFSPSAKQPESYMPKAGKKSQPTRGQGSNGHR